MGSAAQLESKGPAMSDDMAAAFAYAVLAIIHFIRAISGAT